MARQLHHAIMRTGIVSTRDQSRLEANPIINERRKERCRNQAERAAEVALTAAAETVLAAAERAVTAVPDGPARPETVPDVVVPMPLQNGNND